VLHSTLVPQATLAEADEVWTFESLLRVLPIYCLSAIHSPLTNIIAIEIQQDVTDELLPLLNSGATPLTTATAKSSNNQ
jgi:hypothetical protein